MNKILKYLSSTLHIIGLITLMIAISTLIPLTFIAYAYLFSWLSERHLLTIFLIVIWLTAIIYLALLIRYGKPKGVNQTEGES